MNKRNALPALAGLALALAAPATAQAPAAPAVAVAQASVEDPGHAPIAVAIWAPAEGSGLPLVVISHGTGAGMTSHVDTARSLAGAGFVVVAPMHPGDNFQDESAVGRPNWIADRSRHVSRVIDFMLARWDGHGRIAPDRIGLFGFSAGATTALVAIGGVPDLARLGPHCATQREFVCNIIPPAAAAAGGEPPRWTHDRRVAAAVVAAPGLGFLFEPAGLAAVRAPVQLWVGAADDIVPYETNGAVIRRLLPQAPDFQRVEDAVHLSFLAPCTPQSPPQLCRDRPGFDRAAFHQRFNQAVIAFFRQHLGGMAGR
jgi:predicted dienelactone hydrolase